MKQTHIGIDIIEISRIRQAVSRWKERFLRRIYTDAELNLYAGKVESLAARFACKEAAFKALNLPGSAIKWQDIEILSGNNGEPVIRLYGRAQQRAIELGLRRLETSLSHSREHAIALVIGIGED